eukprot:g2079.t1
MALWEYQRQGEFEWQPFAQEDADMLELQLSLGETRFVTKELSFNKAFGTAYKFSFSGDGWTQRNMDTNTITSIRRNTKIYTISPGSKSMASYSSLESKETLSSSQSVSFYILKSPSSPNASKRLHASGSGSLAEDGKFSANDSMDPASEAKTTPDGIDQENAVAETEAFRPGTIKGLPRTPFYMQIPWGYLGFAIVLCWMGYLIYTWDDTRATNTDYADHIAFMFKVFGISFGAVLIWALYLPCVVFTTTRTSVALIIVAKLAILVKATVGLVYWCLFELVSAYLQFGSLSEITNVVAAQKSVKVLTQMFQGKRSDIFKISFLFSLLMLVFCFFAVGFAELEEWYHVVLLLVGPEFLRNYCHYVSARIYLNVETNLERTTMPVTSEMWLALKWHMLGIVIVSGLTAFDVFGAPIYLFTMWLRIDQDRALLYLCDVFPMITCVRPTSRNTITFMAQAGVPFWRALWELYHMRDKDWGSMYERLLVRGVVEGVGVAYNMFRTSTMEWLLLSGGTITALCIYMLAPTSPFFYSPLAGIHDCAYLLMSAKKESIMKAEVLLSKIANACRADDWFQSSVHVDQVIINPLATQNKVPDFWFWTCPADGTDFKLKVQNTSAVGKKVACPTCGFVIRTSPKPKVWEFCSDINKSAQPKVASCFQHPRTKWSKKVFVPVIKKKDANKPEKDAKISETDAGSSEKNAAKGSEHDSQNSEKDGKNSKTKPVEFWRWKVNLRSKRHSEQAIAQGVLNSFEQSHFLKKF